jgi:Zn-finger nucleic acid-binding protein
VSGPFRKEDDPDDDIDYEDFRTWLSDRKCPDCLIPLYSGRRKRVALDACGGCGGVWVDADNARHLLESKDPAFAMIAAAAAKGSEQRSRRREARHCPDCGVLLKEGFLETGRVNVDVCTKHGTWFDAWELNAVVDHLGKQSPTTPVGPFDRPLEMETPFVALLRRVYDHIKSALPGR